MSGKKMAEIASDVDTVQLNAVKEIQDYKFRGPRCVPENTLEMPLSDRVCQAEGYINKETQIAMYTEAGIRYDEWINKNFANGYPVEPDEDEELIFPEMDGRRVDELQVLERLDYYKKVKKEAADKQKRWSKERNDRAEPETPPANQQTVETAVSKGGDGHKDITE